MTFSSLMCSLKVTASFWQVWKDFEIKHGNEDTVREMLRIKRSIQAKFNTQVNFMSAQMIAAEGGAGEKRILQISLFQLYSPLQTSHIRVIIH